MSTKVLLISPYSMNFYGGVQHQINILKEYLGKYRFQVRILSPNSSDYDIGNPVKIPFNGSMAPIKLFPSKKIINEALNWADIIHIHEPFIPLFFWRIPIDKRTVITHHAALSKIFLFLQNNLLTSESDAYAITAVSKVASAGLRNNQNMRIIPNSVIIKSKKLNDLTGTSFLFIGRDEKRKNFKLFRELALQLADANNKFSSITNKDVSIQGINNYVNPDNSLKKKIFAESNVYLAVNTHGESFGITLIEAISEGCLVVSSDIDAFKEVLGDTGIFFDNNSLNSLIHKVSNLKNLDIQQLHKKQLNFIQKYDTNKVIKSWISLYSEIR